jgi:serine/threonine-protein phosphatase 2B catalytic subunit
MLAAVLNICTQEELKEDLDGTVVSVAPIDPDIVEHRRVIKNKILAVGRMARIFSVLWWALRSFPH